MVKFFGTDGIRGEFGGRCVNVDVAKKLGVAIVKFINKQNTLRNSLHDGGGGSLLNTVIVLGRDTRESGALLMEAIEFGAKTNKNVSVVNVGVVPTPCVSFACGEIGRMPNTNCVGVMVSASHNKYSDNGFKIFDGTGFKIGDDFVEYIEDFLSSDYDFDVGDGGANDGAGAGDDAGVAAGFAMNVAGLVDGYCDNIMHACEKLTENMHRDGLTEGGAVFDDETFGDVDLGDVTLGDLSLLKMRRVILDAANGAGFDVAKRVFEGMNFDTTIINAEPDGRNINYNCGATDLTSLSDFVKSRLKETLDSAVEEGDNAGAVAGEDADAVAGADADALIDASFALDGDADRVAIVDCDGEPFNGDNVICSIAIWLKKLRMLKGDAIVVTSVSNGGVEACLLKYGIKVFRCDVGDRSVMREIHKRGLSFGGEESGHLIFADFNKCGDGVFSAAFLSLLMVKTGRTMTQLMDVGFKSRFQVKGDISHDMATPYLPSEITDKISKIADYVTQFFNGLGNADRVVIRASGTEKKVRFMVECDDEALRNKVCAAVKENIKLALRDEDLTVDELLKR